MLRTANPALNDKTFRNLAYSPGAADTMTIQGTVNRAAILLLLVLIGASWTWNKFFAAGDPAAVAPFIMIGAFGGFAVAMVTVFKKTWAPTTAPIYAALEGLFLGGLSAVFEAQFPGIVLQAVGLTFGTLFCLLAAYKSGLIKPTGNFKLGIVAATGAGREYGSCITS